MRKGKITYIKRDGSPDYAVWLLDGPTGEWHCWAQVHDPAKYPNLLDEINAGKYWHRWHKNPGNYVEIQFLPNDGIHIPK